MTEAFASVWRTADEQRLPLRTAAFVIALQRVMKARQDRGFD